MQVSSRSSNIPILMSIIRASSPWSWAWTSVVGFILVSYFLYALRNKRNIKYMTSLLPPGPKGLPILGNLLMLGEFPHRDLHRLSKQYGPIMYLRLGFVPTIVISSPQAAELFLKTYDLIFASRPFNEAAKYISYDRKGLSFSEYGPYWRSVRKLCTLELLSTLKIESFKSMRYEEVGLFIESLKEASSVRREVDLSAKVLALSTDMSCLMVFGKKYIQNGGQGGFHTVVQEGMQLAALFNIADYIPYIGALDIQGLAKRMKAVSKVFDDMFEKIIDEHVGARNGSYHQPDFVHVLLSIMESKDNEFKIDRSNIKSIILDMLVGSMDTSSTAIEWVLAELLKHPDIMKKVQQELEREVGLERMVEESDLANLQYLDMALKESFRLHPVAPLLIPHESMEDCRVSGYHIPRKSRIIVNTWAIGRDPKAWAQADKFIPERFMGSSIDFKGRDFQFLPFGAGRRGCPGMQLGLTVIRFVVAQLVHCFDWELPEGMLCEELNMDEEFGLTMPRAKHLSIIPKYRLSL